ncbi:hypothetical protein AR540_07415 [Pseudomonas sp. EpS/L25]|nr:hypothetical protein AR540_07415 [Pseudomonas sp. EpS/L25]
METASLAGIQLPASERRLVIESSVAPSAALSCRPGALATSRPARLIVISLCDGRDGGPDLMAPRECPSAAAFGTGSVSPGGPRNSRIA